jgi:hypothetical protein
MKTGKVMHGDVQIIIGPKEGKGLDATVQGVMSQEVKYCFEDEEVS